MYLVFKDEDEKKVWIANNPNVKILYQDKNVIEIKVGKGVK